MLGLAQVRSFAGSLHGLTGGCDQPMVRARVACARAESGRRDTNFATAHGHLPVRPSPVWATFGRQTASSDHGTRHPELRRSRQSRSSPRLLTAPIQLLGWPILDFHAEVVCYSR